MINALTVVLTEASRMPDEKAAHRLAGQIHTGTGKTVRCVPAVAPKVKTGLLELVSNLLQGRLVSRGLRHCQG